MPEQKSWRDIHAPNWGFTDAKPVAGFRFGWGVGDGAWTVDSGQNVACLVLGGFERDNSIEVPEGRTLLRQKFIFRQLFWCGEDALHNANRSIRAYLQVLTEIKEPTEEERAISTWYHNFCLYTVGFKVDDQGMYTGGPACEWQDMIDGVCYVIDEASRSKWNEYYDKKEHDEVSTG